MVGNSTYAHIVRLPNPENDAGDISAAQRRLGFEVTTELDVDRVEMTEALRAFTRRSAGADVSMAFYAGHGIEMDALHGSRLCAAERRSHGGGFPQFVSTDSSDLCRAERLSALAGLKRAADTTARAKN